MGLTYIYWLKFQSDWLWALQNNRGVGIINFRLLYKYVGLRRIQMGNWRLVNKK